MPNMIHLIGDFRREEALASGTVKPGHLLEITSATVDTVKAHATQGGHAERAFAVEDALQGNEITDDYASGARVEYNVEDPGAVVQAIILAGEDIAKGDKLISNGDGTLIENGSEASGVTVRQVIGYALEACDLTGSGAVNTLCTIRLL